MQIERTRISFALWFFFSNSPYWLKSKGLPQQAEVAQRVPGRLRPRIFLTFRHYKGGRSSAKHTGRLYPGRNPWYSLSEAESTSGEPRKKLPVTPPGIDPGIVRLVAQCLNHYSTPGTPPYWLFRCKYGGRRCFWIDCPLYLFASGLAACLCTTPRCSLHHLAQHSDHCLV